jgi:hypothetical protein
MDEKDMVRMLGFGRLVIGGLSFLAPRRTAKVWTGESPEMAVSHMAVRGMGARDVALGLGMLIALENDGHIRGWLEASALADAGDAASTILSWNRFGNVRKIGWLALELAAAYYAMQLADALD